MALSFLKRTSNKNRRIKPDSKKFYSPFIMPDFRHYFVFERHSILVGNDGNVTRDSVVSQRKFTIKLTLVPEPHTGGFMNEVVADGVRMAGRRSVQRG